MMSHLHALNACFMDCLSCLCFCGGGYACKGGVQEPGDSALQTGTFPGASLIQESPISVAPTLAMLLLNMPSGPSAIIVAGKMLAQ